MKTRRELLERAVEITYGDRNQVYGDWHTQHIVLATFWKAYISGRARTGDPTTAEHDMAMFQALVKLSRIICGKFHPDNYIDLVNYVAGAYESEMRSRGGYQQ